MGKIRLVSMLTRRVLLVLGAVICVLSAASQSPAAVINDSPTILGPSSSVTQMAGGFGGTFTVVNAQGITNPEVNAARWDASLAPGTYLVEAFIPREAGVTYARYAITHAGTTSEVRLHQVEFGNVWVSLGVYRFDASQSSVRSTDAAGDAGQQLAWDAIRWTPVDAVPPNVESDGDTTIVDDPQVSGPEEDVARFVGVGLRDDLLRTYAQGADATAVNTATWSVPLLAGTYDVSAFIPKEHAEADVSYTLRTTTGNVKVPVAQSTFLNTWVSLGRATFGANAVVTSSDATGKLGQEIAWDALRFVRVPSPPGEQHVSPPPPDELPKQTSPVTGTGTETQPTPPDPGPGTDPPPTPKPTLPLVAAQHRDLLAFLSIELIRPGRRSGPKDGYVLARVNPTSSSLHVKITCVSCRAFGKNPRFGTAGPITHRVAQKTSAAQLRKTRLYKGSVLRVVVSQKNRIPRTYTFKLTGGKRVACTIGSSTKGRACK